VVVGSRRYESQRGEVRGELAFRTDGAQSGLVAVDGSWSDVEPLGSGDRVGLNVDIRVRGGELVVFLREVLPAAL
jgi:hypothetical protein